MRIFPTKMKCGCYRAGRLTSAKMTKRMCFFFHFIFITWNWIAVPLSDTDRSKCIRTLLLFGRIFSNPKNIRIALCTRSNMCDGAARMRLRCIPKSIEKVFYYPLTNILNRSLYAFHMHCSFRMNEIIEQLTHCIIKMFYNWMETVISTHAVMRVVEN